MSTHLRRTAASQTAACGKAIKDVTAVVLVESLLDSATPCRRCLDWVVEQGQIASRRLATLDQYGVTNGNEQQG
jgi:hypothetical protein